MPLTYTSVSIWSVQPLSRTPTNAFKPSPTAIHESAQPQSSPPLIGFSVDSPGLGIEPNSWPPLWPRFLPVMWKLWPLEGFASALSPEWVNRERKPCFFGLGSSFRPTSSNVSSSGGGSGRLNEVLCRGGLECMRESRDWRGRDSPFSTGERAEMSYDTYVSLRLE